MTEHHEQAMPTRNDHVSIQSLVRADLDAREQVGISRYGTALQPHNGRDALRDAYEEAMDLTCYLRQAIEERDNPKDRPPIRAEWRCDFCDRLLFSAGRDGVIRPAGDFPAWETSNVDDGSGVACMFGDPKGCQGNGRQVSRHDRA